ncbi:5-hydroxytryptamine receptor 1A-like [Pecten maximus]|uniref:5-hydroxytryptamine receptor 1A-like n=1 Tax=Pecten maximus TaxID=6579 RepID=UPI0014580A0C|nr:5-hydroxytryptamine receptor 1A-like [Pecten maximus]XP_033756398.1 5-hydroxytryptamine receptor 1A-like [Pecten maximus]XP_033756399.1 5-hydroxytryptamine receptor 1A-like [Pecten maximus]XP_033756402.1 5-hydroxytryptamine receptor 1A-like [Pecten maximus]XP_033756403.1 5-hydroxytryptamine receptor 1A-like [Pecten maximus]XP_033756404.1 5-hydroxytryptamine receptor 1A-like [Pecten maximus]XP_033756405.1 5-hydroxytryptamine receptor 1A-like [Pecten maximus]XP_033756406.1 5-hydroxytryptami
MANLVFNKTLAVLPDLALDNDTAVIYTTRFNSSLSGNSSAFPGNDTTIAEGYPPRPDSRYEVWQQVLITMVLVMLTTGTVIGNSLVCIAVGIVKRLQTPSNLLILSLAVSDLLVAICVMPFNAAYEVMSYWSLGEVVCDLFTSLDVILCTASILNLCMISVDRYFVITRPFKYAMRRTPRLMGLMIAGVWSTSVVISIPPLLGWKTERPPWHCLISQEIGYQIYATLCAFYLPLTVMLVVYFRIWKVSSRLMKSENKSKLGSIDKGNDQIYLPSKKSSKSSGISENTIVGNGNLKNGNYDGDDPSMEMLGHTNNVKASNGKRRFTLRSFLTKSTKMVSSSKEAKATKTLGVIMGGFVACWLPFFILAVIRPFCGAQEQYCSIPPWLGSVFVWLGYFNSFLNPLIYARFNREFRTPFKEILCFRCKGINSRIRSESYVEQYGPDPTFRDSLRPPTETIVRYNSQGHTIVHVGNGNACPDESKL